jgi:hypothetical protein
MDRKKWMPGSSSLAEQRSKGFFKVFAYSTIIKEKVLINTG